MSLREELQNRADKLDAELLALSGRIRAIEHESDDVHTCINALDLAEMDAQDAALEPAPDITFNDIEPVSVTIEAPAQPDPPSAELRSVPGAEENAGTNLEDEDGDLLRHDEAEAADAKLLEDEPPSVLDDPELIAAASRAEATLQQAEPNYVGLQDPELEREYDAMRERQEAGKKLHFSIFGKVGE